MDIQDGGGEMDKKTAKIIGISTGIIVLLLLIAIGLMFGRKGRVGKFPLKGWEIVKVKYDDLIYEKKDGTWYLTSPHLYRVDSTKMQEKLNRLKDFRIGEFIDRGNLGDYGLDKEHRSKLVAYIKKGDSLIFYLGKNGPVSLSFYLTMDTLNVYLGYGFRTPLFPKNEQVLLDKKVYEFTSVDSMKVYKNDKLLKRYRDTTYTKELSDFLPRLKAYEILWDIKDIKPVYTVKVYTPLGEFEDRIAPDTRNKNDYIVLRDSVGLRIPGFRIKRYLNPPDSRKIRTVD